MKAISAKVVSCCDYDPKNDATHAWHHSMHVLMLGYPVVNFLQLKSCIGFISFA